MSIILPSVNFDRNNNSKTGKNKIKQIKDVKLTNESDEINIDDIYTIFPQNEEISEENETDRDDILCIKEDQIDLNIFPTYNGIEPYYLFKRRLDGYMNKKLKHDLHSNILCFLNLLFETDYKNLISIKKIKEQNIPSSDYVIDTIKTNKNFKDNFKIKYNRNVPADKLLDRLLNKIGFSFAKKIDGHNTYYFVKNNPYTIDAY